MHVLDHIASCHPSGCPRIWQTKGRGAADIQLRKRAVMQSLRLAFSTQGEPEAAVHLYATTLQLPLSGSLPSAGVAQKLQGGAHLQLACERGHLWLLHERLNAAAHQPYRGMHVFAFLQAVTHCGLCRLS